MSAARWRPPYPCVESRRGPCLSGLPRFASEWLADVALLRSVGCCSLRAVGCGACAGWHVVEPGAVVAPLVWPQSVVERVPVFRQDLPGEIGGRAVADLALPESGTGPAVGGAQEPSPGSPPPRVAVSRRRNSAQTA